MAKGARPEKNTSPRKPTRRRLATEELLGELATLRGVTIEIIENVRLELESGLLEAQRALGPGAHGRVKKIPVGNLEAALERIRALRVKPKKGRLKDLRRLAALLEELDELLGGNG